MHPRPVSPSPPIGIHRRASFPALTILELLVSLAIFASVMLVIAQAITTIQATWIKTRALLAQAKPFLITTASSLLS